MLAKIAMTFVWCLAYLAAIVAITRCFIWTQHRKAQPGYAPLWVMALVIGAVLAFAVLALARMAVGLEPGRTGTHRKPSRRAAAALLREH